MKNINYSEYGQKSTGISDELLTEITSGLPDYDKEELLDSELFLRVVEAPFIIADNEFDLHESNNNVYEINVKKLRTVSFTGGNYYIEYDKDDSSKESYVIQGTEEEGYNIFNIK